MPRSKPSRRRPPVTASISNPPKSIAAHAPPQALRDLEARATAALRTGNPALALDLADQALARAGSSPPATLHAIRGVILRALKRPAEAVAAYERALAAGAAPPTLHNNYGNALRAVGRHAEAEAQFRLALQGQPDYPEALHNLGLLLTDQRRYDEAAAHLRQALALRPDYVDARIQLGNVVGQLQGYRAAIQEYMIAYAKAPNHLALNLNIGTAYRHLADFETGRRYIERAHALAPDHPEVKLAMAAQARDSGDAAAAAAAVRGALATDPRAASAYLQLASLPAPHGLNAAEARACTMLLDDARLDERDKARLLFALGQYNETLARPDAAFACFERANAIERRFVKFDLAQVRENAARTKAIFTPEFYAAHRGWGSPSARPIFIFGLPRSGTTLVEQILAAHPQVAAGGECVFSIAASERIANAYGGYPEGLARMDRAAVAAEAARFLGALERIDPSRPRTTDKLPFNFRHLGMLATMFPRASFIHCLRDPRDIALSCYFIAFQNPVTFSYDLADFGQHYLVYEELMDFHRRAAPVPMLDVHYENVARFPEQAAHAIVAHCGLEWDDRCLSFHKQERQVRTASAFQVRSAVYTRSIGRWRAYGRHLAQLYGPLSKARYFQQHADHAAGGPQFIAPVAATGAPAA